MKFQLISCTYDNSDYGRPMIHLYGRDKDGRYVKSNIKDFKPYLYVRLPKDVDEHSNVAKYLNTNESITSYQQVNRFLPSGYQTEKIEMLKVWTNKPGDVSQIRDTIIRNDWGEVFEADVLFPQRFLVDNALWGMRWVEVDDNEARSFEKEEDAPLNVLAFDIEVLPPEDGSIPKFENDPILMISFASNQPRRENCIFVAMPRDELPIELISRPNVICFNNEKNMLLAFKEMMGEYDPDVITGYNSNKFDFPYIVGRMSQLGLNLDIGRDGRIVDVNNFGQKAEVRINGRCCFDMMDIVKANYSLDSYSLKVAAHELLKKEKLDVKASEMRSIWVSKDDRLIKFINYALKDADLVMDMALDLRLLDRYVAISKVSGVQLQDAMNAGQMQRIESLLLRAFKQEGRVFPLRRRHGSNDQEDVKGAIVLEPDRGLHSNVIIMDFASLYPSAIRAYNISWDTIVDSNPIFDKVEDFIDELHLDTIKTPNDAYFVDHKVKMGIMPSILADLYQKRVEAKKQMKGLNKDDKLYEYLDNKQYSLKIMLNSWYGYTGSKASRLYDQRLANAVTSVGRNTLMKTKEVVEASIFDGVKLKAITGDTDSLYLEANHDITASQAEKIGELVNQEMKKVLPPPMDFSYEAFAKRIIIHEKKRYAAMLEDKDGKQTMKFRGIEVRRRDWTPLTKETLKHCYDLILKEGKIDEAIKYSREIIDKVKKLDDVKSNMKLFESLILSKKIGRKLEDYDGLQPHVEICKKMKERGESYGLGDRIQYLVLPGNGPVSNRVETPSYVIEKGLYVDNAWYINVQLVKPLGRLFEALGVSEKKLMENKNQRALWEYM